MNNMDTILFIPLTILFLENFPTVSCQSYNDVICRRPWYFNSPRPAPLRCPTPSFFGFYECCGEFRENCCWKVRQEPIYILVICFVILLLLCCCCCVAWFLMSFRSSKNKEATTKLPQKVISKDEQIQTISRNTMDSGTQSEIEMRRISDADRRRSYAAARDREFDYQYFT